MARRKRYGILHFFLDVFLVIITGGLWGIWLIFKFLRTNS